MPDTPPLDEPPRGTLLDRLARWLDGGGRGTPVDEVLDLSSVLDRDALGRLPPEVIAFFTSPHGFRIRAGLDAAPVSRFLLAISAIVARQTNIPDRERGFESYPVGQLIYRDARGRTHWDRYGLVDGEWRRLFLARVGGEPGKFFETFVLYGVPVVLPFRAHVDGDTLVMTLQPRLSAPFSWFGRVEYRTRRTAANEVETRGDFRIPVIAFRVAMEFRGRRVAAL
ncbi:MAG: hypothetical protein JWP87_6430 [Labilithrix sp.]|nr:hypothetical protein [Labilithrix sp.]